MTFSELGERLTEQCGHLSASGWDEFVDLPAAGLIEGDGISSGGYVDAGGAKVGGVMFQMREQDGSDPSSAVGRRDNGAHDPGTAVPPLGKVVAGKSDAAEQNVAVRGDKGDRQAVTSRFPRGNRDPVREPFTSWLGPPFLEPKCGQRFDEVGLICQQGNVGFDVGHSPIVTNS